MISARVIDYRTDDSVAYGSLYLDKGETMAIVKKQIKSFVKYKPIAVFFDVLDNSHTVPTEDGELYVERVKDMISKNLPYLKQKDIHVGFSNAD